MSETKNLHVRDVPGDVHAVLAERAARRGTSLRQYVVEVLAEHTGLPTVDEWLDGLRELPTHPAEIDTVGALEQARGEDDEEVMRVAPRR